MAKKTFAETLASAQLMAKALQESGNLPAGIEPSAAHDLERFYEEVTKINQEQEKLKAQLKEKTAQLDASLKKLDEKYAFIKKYIKLGVPQELWRQYGRGQTIVRHGNSCIPRGCSFFRHCAKKYPDCAEEKIDFCLKILTFAVALVGVPRGF